MSRVLYIKANPKESKDSDSLKLGNYFVEKLRENNPNDEVEVLDLYQMELHNLTKTDLEEIRLGKDTEMKKAAEYFASFDKYIIAAPMWNLSFPAILKTYIDYIFYVGIAFVYTPQGPEGLLENKKVLYVTTRGGLYSKNNVLEPGENYLREVFKFAAITDFDTLALEGTNFLVDEAKKLAIEEVYQSAALKATNF